VAASSGSGAAVEPFRSSVQYPGGLAARYRWVGSGHGDAIAAMSEASGTLTDHGLLVSAEFERLCRAELRVEGPLGTWTARFASVVFDEPAGLLWDTQALLVVKYGFLVYALKSRTGELRWTRASGSPLVAVIGSSRLDHVIAQSEVETVALGPDGEPRWRAAHSDVVTDAEIVGGRLILTTWTGAVLAIDPATGRTLD
jgi:hypothetical protein